MFFRDWLLTLQHRCDDLGRLARITSLHTAWERHGDVLSWRRQVSAYRDLRLIKAVDRAWTLWPSSPHAQRRKRSEDARKRAKSAPPPMEGPMTDLIPFPAHMDRKGRLTLDGQRARPLKESEDLPADITGRDRLFALPDHLDVEHSARYRRKKRATYCNIYATDVAFLCGVYLPRVWWKKPNHMTPDTEVKYGITVRELSADSLYEWINLWAERYGWTVHQGGPTGHERSRLATRLQETVNDPTTPTLGIICARAPGKRRGHIVVVLPEQPGVEGWQANRNQHGDIVPLQSQAGGSNKKLFVNKWYLLDDFDRVAFASIPITR